MAEKKTFYLGTGRRKSAVARVRLTDGKGSVMINGRALDRYFTEEKDRLAVMGPMLATDMVNRLDVIVKTTGGGITGQADAIKQGVARALKTMFAGPAERRTFTFGNTTVVRAHKDPKGVPTPVPTTSLAPPVEGAPVVAEDPAMGIIKKLREGKFLTRDSRMKERKKYGLRGARRGTQFSKR